MKYAVLGVALVILVVGIWVLTLTPDEPPSETSGPEAPAGVVVEQPAAETPRQPLRLAWNVIEQVSEAIDDNGVLLESVGFHRGGGLFTPIIPAGERTPIQRAYVFGTVMTGQTEMRVHLYRGTSDKVEENHSLGWFSITGMSPGPAASDKVALVLKVGDDAIIGAAIETETRRALTFAPADPTSKP